jgi:hypothetical protein
MPKEDLMTVVKEANQDIEELKKKAVSEVEMKAHYQRFYDRVDDQCDSFDFFVTICLQDLKFNFSGGSIIPHSK